MRWRNFGLRGRWRNQRNLFDDVESGTPDKPSDDRARKPGRIVFHAHSLRLAVEVELPDAINLACPGQRKQYSLGGLSSIAEHDIHVRHGYRIAAARLRGCDARRIDSGGSVFASRHGDRLPIPLKGHWLAALRGLE